MLHVAYAEALHCKTRCLFLERSHSKAASVEVDLLCSQMVTMDAGDFAKVLLAAVAAVLITKCEKYWH